MKKKFLLCNVKMACAALMAALALPAMAQQADSVKVKTLEAVTINGTRASQSDPITTSNMNQKQISDSKTSISVPYILNLLPSVVADGENGLVGNTTMRVRGIDETRINVSINGITLNDAESQKVYWVNIPNLAGMAQSIQLQRGATAAVGGSGFGGAISMQTVNGKFVPYAVVDLGGGSFGTLQYGIMAGSGVGKHGWSADVAYNGMQTNGFVRNGFANHQSMFFGLSHYGERSLFKAIAIIGKQKTGITWNGSDSASLVADPTYNSSGLYYDADGNLCEYDNETDNYFQRHYQLYYNYELSSRWNINAIGDITFGDGYYENYKDDKKPGSKYGLITGANTLAKSDFITRKLMDNVAYTANVSARYHTDNLQVVFGEMAQIYDGKHFGHIIWAQDTSLYRLNGFGDDNPYEWYRNNSLKKDFTSFVRANWNINDAHQVYADLQLRSINYTMDSIDDDDLWTPLNVDLNYLFFNPKVGYNHSWICHEDVLNRIYAVAAINNREPCRSDIKDAFYNSAWYGAGDTILPETMLDIEAGYQISTIRLSASANIYAMLYKNQLTPSGRINSASGYALMENVAKSYRAGIELEAGWRVADFMDIAANLTLSQNKIVDYNQHVSVMDDYWDFDHTDSIYFGNTDLSFSPNVIGAGIITLRPFYNCGAYGKNFTLQLIGKYVGEMYVDNTSREEMKQDDYFLFNIKAGYVWPLKVGELEAQVVVNNVLNHQFMTNAWNSSYYFTDPANNYTERAYFMQPGTHVMGRLVYRF